MTVNCREARELADPFLSNQLLVETTHGIVKHLETCPACRDEVAARRTLRMRLQSAIGSAADLAPRPDFVAALSDRLRPMTPEEGISRRVWLQSWWAAAAAAVALLGGGLFTRDALRRSRLLTLAAGAAGDHQNCAIKFNLTERPIPLEDAAQRHDPAYQSLIALEAPVGLPGGPAAILERHSCVFEGRRFAHLVLRYRDHIASLLVTGGFGLAGAEPALVDDDSALQVAAFDTTKHAVFVVSDLPESDTLALARALAEPVARGLSST